MELDEMTNKDIYRQITSLRKEKRVRKRIGFWPEFDPDGKEDWRPVNMISPTEMTNDELYALLTVINAEKRRRKKIGQWGNGAVSVEARSVISRAKAIQRNNTSGHKGVAFNKSANKWHARIGSKHLGYFKTIEESIKARQIAETELWGE